MSLYSFLASSCCFLAWPPGESGVNHPSICPVPCIGRNLGSIYTQMLELVLHTSELLLPSKRQLICLPWVIFYDASGQLSSPLCAAWVIHGWYSGKNAASWQISKGGILSFKIRSFLVSACFFQDSQVSLTSMYYFVISQGFQQDFRSQIFCGSLISKCTLFMSTSSAAVNFVTYHLKPVRLSVSISRLGDKIVVGSTLGQESHSAHLM